MSSRPKKLPLPAQGSSQRSSQPSVQRASSGQGAGRQAADILGLQRSIGNQAVQRLLTEQGRLSRPAHPRPASDSLSGPTLQRKIIGLDGEEMSTGAVNGYMEEKKLTREQIGLVTKLSAANKPFSIDDVEAALSKMRDEHFSEVNALQYANSLQKKAPQSEKGEEPTKEPAEKDQPIVEHKEELQGEVKPTEDEIKKEKMTRRYKLAEAAIAHTKAYFPEGAGNQKEAYTRASQKLGLESRRRKASAG